jgi:hypothetical protein
MTDLVRCGSLAHAPRGGVASLLHRYMWATQRQDTFGSLESFVTRLRGAGYEFLATHELYRRIDAERPAASGR